MRILLANLTKMVNDTGGLAKVTAAFANEMNRRGHVVSLVYSDVQAGNFYYPLSKEVASYDLCHYEGRTVTYPLRYKVRREILRPFSKSLSRSVNNDFTRQYLLDNLRSVLERTMPECIVAFQPAASKALLCDLHVTTPVITMSHGDPKDYFHIYPKEEIPALAKSAACQVLLPSFSEHIKEHLPGARTVVIGNSISQFEEQADLSAEKERYIIVFVGRLTKIINALIY